jgi:hypothetical protein
MRRQWRALVKHCNTGFWPWVLAAAALGLPWLLDRVPDQPAMLSGDSYMALELSLIAISPDMFGVLIGVGWFLVQRLFAKHLVNQSSAPADWPTCFSAQFVLSRSWATGNVVEHRKHSPDPHLSVILSILLWP